MGSPSSLVRHRSSPHFCCGLWVPACAETTKYLFGRQTRKIVPIRVVLLDQPNFPIAIPFLQLLLAANRLFGILVGLDMDEERNLIFLDELGALARAMELQPLAHTVRDADIKRAVLSAGEYVD